MFILTQSVNSAGDISNIDEIIEHPSEHCTQVNFQCFSSRLPTIGSPTGFGHGYGQFRIRYTRIVLWLTCVPRRPPSASPTETNIATLETPAQRTRCTACGERTALLPRTLRGWPCTVTCHYVGSFQCAPCLTACEIGDEAPHSQSLTVTVTVSAHRCTGAWLAHVGLLHNLWETQVYRCLACSHGTDVSAD